MLGLRSAEVEHGFWSESRRQSLEVSLSMKVDKGGLIYERGSLLEKIDLSTVSPEANKIITNIYIDAFNMSAITAPINSS